MGVLRIKFGGVCACSLVLLPAISASASSNWTDVASDSMADTPYSSMGATFADVDGDGFDDLLISSGSLGGGPVYLFMNDGDGSFTQISNGFLAEIHNVWSPLVGDFDNDGDGDIFTIGFGERCHLVRNDDGIFNSVDINDTFAIADNLYGRGGAWVDTDADGLLDIMVSTNAAVPWVGSDKLFRNAGDSTFVDVTPEVFGHYSVGRGVAWCDFDNDGRVDCYAAAGNGCPCNWEAQPLSWIIRAENRMLRNLGDNEFEDVTTNVTLDIDQARGVAAGDYDNDGDIDLYIANLAIVGGEDGENNIGWIGGYNTLLRNDGDFQFTDVTPSALECYGGYRSCAFGDVDNDGDLDLMMIAQSTNLTDKLFENIDGGLDWVRRDLDAFGSNEWQGHSGAACAISDYDTDGDLDVFITYKTGSNRLLRNDIDNENNWIQFDLEGVQSNRDAVGARVIAVSDTLVQIREVQTGTGYWSQHSLVQHIGLRHREVLDEVIIRWPSGIRQRYLDVPAGHRYDVVECIECECGADLDLDFEVDVLDLLVIIDQWGDCEECEADFNRDGVIDILDLLVVIDQWGDCPEPEALTP